MIGLNIMKKNDMALLRTIAAVLSFGIQIVIGLHLLAIGLLTTAGRAVYFDVDDTLILWPHTTDRLSVSQLCDIDALAPLVKIHGFWYRKHLKHIAEVVKQKLLNKTIVIWSANSAQWAKDVAIALDIDKYVDYFLDKPEFYFDDRSLTDQSFKQLYFDLFGGLSVLSEENLKNLDKKVFNKG